LFDATIRGPLTTIDICMCLGLSVGGDDGDKCHYHFEFMKGIVDEIEKM